MVGAIIAAVAAIAGAAMQADAQRSAAKQTRYDAEFEAEQARMQAEQERLDREQAMKVESRQSEEAKRTRLAILTRAGGGIGVSAIQEISRQAAIDELDIQNANQASVLRREGFALTGRNALIRGRAKSKNYRTQATNTTIAGVGSAVGTTASGYGTYRNRQRTLTSRLQSGRR